MPLELTEDLVKTIYNTEKSVGEIRLILIGKEGNPEDGLCQKVNKLSGRVRIIEIAVAVLGAAGGFGIGTIVGG